MTHPRSVIVGIVVAQWVVYFVLAVWLDNVLPNENGVRRRGWYFLLPSYWGLGGRANFRHRKMAATAMCGLCVTFNGCSADSAPPWCILLPSGWAWAAELSARWPATPSEPRVFAEKNPSLMQGPAAAAAAGAVPLRRQRGGPRCGG